MKSKILFAFLLFLATVSFSQKFENSISPSKFTIGENKYPAFKTYVDFKPAIVERGWWKFARQFGKPLNMRKYYQVTIPREMDGTITEIVLYSKPVVSGEGASFSLALDDQNIPKEKKELYLKQLKLILMEFKRYLYLEKYEEQMVAVTKLAEKNGSITGKLKGRAREEKLEELQLLAVEIDRIKMKIIALQK